MNIKQIKEAIQESQYQETQLEEAHTEAQMQDHRNIDEYIRFVSNESQALSDAYSQAFKSNETNNASENV